MSENASRLKTLAQVQKASVARIAKRFVSLEEDAIYDAIMEGVLAPPPRSFPYIAFLAAYTDGRPREAEPEDGPTADLSSLTREELGARALAVARSLQLRGELTVIDVTPIPDETPEQELARLQAEIAEAERELAAAQRELKELQK